MHVPVITPHCPFALVPPLPGATSSVSHAASSNLVPPSRERLQRHSIESSGKLKISPEQHCDFTAEDLRDLGEIGRGAYGSVNKMVFKPTGQIMAVKVTCCWLLHWQTLGLTHSDKSSSLSFKGKKKIKALNIFKNIIEGASTYIFCAIDIEIIWHIIINPSACMVRQLWRVHQWACYRDDVRWEKSLNLTFKKVLDSCVKRNINIFNHQGKTAKATYLNNRCVSMAEATTCQGWQGPENKQEHQSKTLTVVFIWTSDPPAFRFTHSISKHSHLHSACSVIRS